MKLNSTVKKEECCMKMKYDYKNYDFPLNDGMKEYYWELLLC